MDEIIKQFKVGKISRSALLQAFTEEIKEDNDLFSVISEIRDNFKEEENFASMPFELQAEWFAVVEEARTERKICVMFRVWYAEKMGLPNPYPNEASDG